MDLKAQSQFLIIIGILIFVVVVIIFVTQKNLIFPPSSGTIELKKALRTEIEYKIRSESIDTITTIGKKGGYLQTIGTSTSFKGEEVPYWQICQNKIIPSLDTIKQNIKNDLQTKLNSKKFSEFQGKSVSIQDVQNIEVVVRPDDVILRVWMPTSIENTEIEQPYQVYLPLELGKAYDFASSFVTEDSQNNHLSRFLASLLYHSPEKQLPTVGLLTKCGESITVTYDEAKSRVEEIIDHALLNIVFWKNQPIDTDYLNYYIPSVDGKQFPDLQINFYKAEELDRNTFQSSMNPIVIVNSKNLFKLLPKCTKGYDVRYSIRPSVVASIKTKNNFEFDFGLMPFVKNSRIGKCDGVEDLLKLADVCAQAKCPAKILVEDSGGMPVPDTKIVFGPCSLGKTNELGIAEGRISCSISQLSAFNSEYTPFYDIKSGLDLNDTKIILRKGPLLKIHFKKALVNLQSYYNYLKGKTVVTGATIKTGDVDSESIFVQVAQKDSSPWNVFETLISNNDERGLTDTITVDYIPTGKHEFVINSFKTLRLYKRFCTHWKLGGLGPCDRHETIDEMITVPTKISQVFEVKENTTDIYLTAFYPSHNQVSEAPDQYDYGDSGTFAQCLMTVSETPPTSSCSFRI